MPRPPAAAAPRSPSKRTRGAKGPGSEGLLLSEGLDRACERREDPDWIAARLADADSVLIALGPDLEPWLAGPERDRLWRSTPSRTPAPGESQPLFLGVAAGVAYFGCVLDAPPGQATAERRSLRECAALLDPLEGGLAAYARALLWWQQRHRFCGVCGAPTRIASGGHRLVCARPGCDAEHFPRLDPAIIVAVCHGERLLLGRQATWPRGRWSTLAGFVEPGETIEDAVRREVLEEAGVRVGACQYLCSQPWPFPSSLMLGFLARASSLRIQVGSELEAARWFSPDDLCAAVRSRKMRMPPRLALSYRLIDTWFRQYTGRSLAEIESPP